MHRTDRTDPAAHDLRPARRPAGFDATGTQDDDLLRSDLAPVMIGLLDSPYIPLPRLIQE